ncbi:hypothetical protein [Aliivibrio fischeri]|uniref:hypothetical protein n=1 Tax=Aliivibrio fischeri TaxID=668 RepID=UPI0012DAACD8|nr:hypothetical protein [Aliivibrio fischeri]MUK70311.1 hypothetical protein [Aliivibrio fischeri]MUK72025.1 hypothetical protein [Aliivibrio fischeri]
MKTSYSGIYIYLSPNGAVDDVQVIDIGGISMPLPVDIYIERNVQPPLDKLPTEKEFSILVSIHETKYKYPALETTEIKKLVSLGYLERITLPAVNDPKVKAIIHHKLTQLGLNLINK